MSADDQSKFTVYYDRSCPLCRREIAFYQRRSGADRIDWIDVSQSENAPADLSCRAAMARFHIRKTDGQLMDGGAAFAELWKHLPVFRPIGLVFSVPPLRWVINLAYNLFLPLRPYMQGLFRSPAAQPKPKDQRS